MAVTRPGVGGSAISGRTAAASTRASTGRASTADSVARSAASVGTVTPAFSGDTASTTRPSVVISARARSLASRSVMPGTNADAMRDSVSMPGDGSPSRKCETYSRA